VPRLKIRGAELTDTRPMARLSSTRLFMAFLSESSLLSFPRTKPKFYKTGKFITMSTTTYNRSLCRGKLIQSTQHHLKTYSCPPRRRMGEWTYSSTMFYLNIRWRWVVSLTPLYPRYPKDRSLVGPQSRSGRCRENRSILHCRESNPGRPARHYTD
jgi:hypothetical protein